MNELRNVGMVSNYPYSLFSQSLIILSRISLSTKFNVARLYSNIDAAQLQADAESSLLNYGTKYHPEIITHAKEHYIYTVSGHRMLD
jgi:hypothetical protein